MALSAPSCVAFLPSLGVLFRGTVRVVRSKMVEFFLLQKWIDLDELNPMVWVPSIVRRRIDFSLAVFELGAPREVHPYYHSLDTFVELYCMPRRTQADENSTAI